MESINLMTFVPDRSTITGITNASPAVITTSPAHGMYTGMVARLVVPQNYGPVQLNGVAAHVSVISSTQFACYSSLVPVAVPISAVDFPAFVTPTNPGLVASCIPIGEGAVPQTDLAWQIQSNYCDSPLDDTVYNNSTVEIPF
jgi:hypothetical protein